MDILASSITSLMEFIKTYHSSIFQFLKRRRSYYLYIPVGITDFIMNSKITNKINIVKIDDLINQFLPIQHKETFKYAIDKYFDTENPSKEPYKSIVKKCIKIVVNSFLNISSSSKKYLFITDNIRLFELIDSKKKYNAIPMINIINQDISQIKMEDREVIYKSIIDIALNKENDVIRLFTFSNIDELDRNIMKILHLKFKLKQ